MKLDEKTPNSENEIFEIIAPNSYRSKLYGRSFTPSLLLIKLV